MTFDLETAVVFYSLGWLTCCAVWAFVGRRRAAKHAPLFDIDEARRRRRAG